MGENTGMRCKRNPVQHVFQQCPQDQSREARAEPFPAAMPGKMAEIDGRQRDSP